MRIRPCRLLAGSGCTPSARVQTDKTKESLAEINRELHDVLRQRPVTSDELSRAQKQPDATTAGFA